jgi:hypothetical protein
MEREHIDAGAFGPESKAAVDLDVKADAGDADAKDAARADAEAKRNHAMCQIARILAKQAVQKLRQQYKRSAHYKMTLSGVDPFTGNAWPASDYLCLSAPAHAPAALAAPRPDENDESEDSGSEASDDSDNEEGESEAETEENLPESDAKEEKERKGDIGDAKGEAKSDVKAEPNGKDEKVAENSACDRDSKQIAQLAAAAPSGRHDIALEAAVFAENTFVDDYLRAGKTRYGRALKLSGIGAASLYGVHNVR